jgi:hypothetical protein
MDWKSLEFLGSGIHGAVYKTKLGNQECAVKVEHIKEEEIYPNLESPLWRSIQFDMQVARRHPDHFTQLKQYEIHVDQPGDFVMKRPDGYDSWTPGQQHHWDQINSSPHYSGLYYTPVCDGTVWQIRCERLENEGLYVCLDILYKQIEIIWILIRSGWVHHDTHSDNWLYTGSKSNPRIYLVDYGMCRKIDPNFTPTEIEFNEPFFDVASLIHTSIWTPFLLEDGNGSEYQYRNARDTATFVHKNQIARFMKEELAAWLPPLNENEPRTKIQCIAAIALLLRPRLYYSCMLIGDPNEIALKLAGTRNDRFYVSEKERVHKEVVGILLKWIKNLKRYSDPIDE